jgi:hypothetical protein
LEKDEELTDEEVRRQIEEVERHEREAFAAMPPAERKRTRAKLRQRKKRRRPAKDLMVEHFDRTIARYTLDTMIALEASPLDLLGAESAVLDDLDLWAEATGGAPYRPHQIPAAWSRSLALGDLRPLGAL